MKRKFSMDYSSGEFERAGMGVVKVDVARGSAGLSRRWLETAQRACNLETLDAVEIDNDGYVHLTGGGRRVPLGYCPQGIPQEDADELRTLDAETKVIPEFPGLK